jgi:hypothetical protein
MIIKSLNVNILYLFLSMEKKEATKVGCQSCKTSKKIKNTQKVVFVFGGLIFLLSVYGTIRLIQDISSLF